MGNGDKNIPTLTLTQRQREGGREGGRQVEESDAQRPRPWDEIEGEEGPWQTHNNKSYTSVQRCNTEYFEKKIHLKISYMYVH